MKTEDLHSSYNYKSYKGRLANHQSMYSGPNKPYKQYLFVFVDMSSKRLSKKDEINTRWVDKVIFITNKQLMDENNQWFDYGFSADIRQLIDSKAGTRYRTISRSGSYQHCLGKGVIPVPCKIQF